jgi:hypothetical protein
MKFVVRQLVSLDMVMLVVNYQYYVNHWVCTLFIMMLFQSYHLATLVYVPRSSLPFAHCIGGEGSIVHDCACTYECNSQLIH